MPISKARYQKLLSAGCKDCGQAAVTLMADNTPLCVACENARYEARKPEIDARLHQRLGHLGW